MHYVFSLGLLLLMGSSMLQVQAAVGKEVVEQLWKSFGKGALGQTSKQFGRNLEDLIAKYGEDCLSLIRKGGHDAYQALNVVGQEKAGKLVRLFRDKGDDAWPIINSTSKRNLFLAHGDETAEALIKHPGIADDLIVEVGPQTASTIARLGRSEAQLLHKMHKNGDLDKILKSAPNKDINRKFWKVLATYGDKGLTYVWKNKGAMAVAATLVAFVTSPESFINPFAEYLLGPILQWLAPILAIAIVIWLALKYSRRKKST